MPRGGRARPRARGRLLAFVLCCALLTAGCTHRSSRPGDPGGASAAPRVGGTLRIALVTPGSLDPALAGGAAAFAAKPLGNGPFMLTKASKGQTLELVRNPHYSGHAPYLDRVRVQVVPDQQTAWLAFQHGQVSFAPVPPDQVAAARAVAGASADGRRRPGLLQGPELGSWSLGFDLDSQQGSDPRWRRAVSLALDRSRIAAAFQGAVVPAVGLVPTGVPGARQVACPTCTYD